MTAPSPVIRRSDVLTARQVLGSRATRTPLILAEAASDILEARIYLKLECHQRTGAFKYRGALYAATMLLKGQGGELITASSGNHALGVCMAAAELGVRATVVMPATAPLVKIERARALGGEVILHGKVYDEARAHAEELVRSRQAVFLPSFDHPLIMAAQGTVVLEIEEELPTLDMLVVPIGGGGLLAGALAARPDLAVWGVQAMGADSFARSLAAGCRVSIPRTSTFADGIALLAPGELPLTQALANPPEVAVVSDDEILAAMRHLLLYERVVAEPASAAALAALLTGKIPIRGRTVAVVITGGNVMPEVISAALRGSL
ncbi:MAG: L-threonine dehydratase catabolic TdcB [Firmicutes bacterium]|nr:L-threonine dehydratase catabolic TdcB [candidate division NPL-UPA2 bacterium]